MLLGIICNRKKHLVDELQSVTHMYLEGVAEYMNVQPVLIPCPMENGTFDAAPIIAAGRRYFAAGQHQQCAPVALWHGRNRGTQAV